MDLIKRSDVLEVYKRVYFGVITPANSDEFVEAINAIPAVEGEPSKKDLQFFGDMIAKQSAKIAELEAQLARYEVVGGVRWLGGVQVVKYTKSLEAGTKLFALKD